VDHPFRTKRQKSGRKDAKKTILNITTYPDCFAPWQLGVSLCVTPCFRISSINLSGTLQLIKFYIYFALQSTFNDLKKNAEKHRDLLSHL
jgi:hypothetical protein